MSKEVTLAELVDAFRAQKTEETLQQRAEMVAAMQAREVEIAALKAALEPVRAQIAELLAMAPVATNAKCSSVENTPGSAEAWFLVVYNDEGYRRGHLVCAHRSRDAISYTVRTHPQGLRAAPVFLVPDASDPHGIVLACAKWVGALLSTEELRAAAELPTT